MQNVDNNLIKKGVDNMQNAEKEKLMLSFDDIRQRFGISRTSIDRWEKAGTFPKRVRLGVKKIGWHKEQIEEWLNKKIEEND